MLGVLGGLRARRWLGVKCRLRPGIVAVAAEAAAAAGGGAGARDNADLEWVCGLILFAFQMYM